MTGKAKLLHKPQFAEPLTLRGPTAVDWTSPLYDGPRCVSRHIPQATREAAQKMVSVAFATS